jgi:hypothetical protein
MSDSGEKKHGLTDLQQRHGLHPGQAVRRQDTVMPEAEPARVHNQSAECLR